MNRIDRLCAILIQMQTRRIVKAKEIAARFEISLRTVYRDIRALEDAGVPIGSEAGVGYFLCEGYHLPPVMFTRGEAAALLLGGKLTEKFSDLSVNRHFTTAMDKIKAVMGGRDKEYLDQLGSQIAVLNKAPVCRDGFPNDLLLEIQSRLGSNRIIRIQYWSGYKEEVTTREIESLGLCFYAANWHLLAYCRLRGDYRDFRVDRIRRVTPTDQEFDRQRHAPLKELIETIVVNTDLKPAVLRFDHKTARNIRDWKYYYGFVEQHRIGKCIEMDFLTPSHTMLADWLLTLHAPVQVVSPGALQSKLQSRVEQLSRHYLSPA